MKLVRFDPPGFLDDFDEKGKDEWHDYISGKFDDAREGDTERECDFYAPREHFVNPSKVELGDDQKEVDVEWTAFPRQVTINSISDIQRWRIADSSRDKQDEYCEWSVSKTSIDGKITKIMFTCETPEYWQALPDDTLLSLYQEHIDPSVTHEDLFIDGHYNGHNKWNVSTDNGAMHLIQVNNTLGAEIELAGGSSIRRVINGRELTGALELIDCGKYGARERHSDPHIGESTNAVARQKAYVSLANPVGVYFSSLNTLGWETPDGTDPINFWKYTRGTAEKPVRAVFEVPEEFGYVVGDIKINGKNIEYGGQVSDRIQMKLTAVGSDFGKIDIEPMTGCVSCRPKSSVLNKSITERIKSVGSIKKSR